MTAPTAAVMRPALTTTRAVVVAAGVIETRSTAPSKIAATSRLSWLLRYTNVVRYPLNSKPEEPPRDEDDRQGREAVVVEEQRQMPAGPEHRQDGRRGVAAVPRLLEGVEGVSAP